MPTPYLQKLSKKHKISIDQLEKVWQKAKEIAAKAGYSNNYGYIVGIFKKIIKGKFDIKEQYNKNYYQLKNGFILKRNDKWECQLFEASFIDYIKVGGILMLLYNWLTYTSRQMKKMKLSYGDEVIKIEKDSFGKTNKTSGILIKKNGYPQVYIRSETGIIRYEKWTEKWIPDK